MTVYQFQGLIKSEVENFKHNLIEKILLNNIGEQMVLVSPIEILPFNMNLDKAIWFPNAYYTLLQCSAVATSRHFIQHCPFLFEIYSFSIYIDKDASITDFISTASPVANIKDDFIGIWTSLTIQKGSHFSLGDNSYFGVGNVEEFKNSDGIRYQKIIDECDKSQNKFSTISMIQKIRSTEYDKATLIYNNAAY